MNPTLKHDGTGPAKVPLVHGGKWGGARAQTRMSWARSQRAEEPPERNSPVPQNGVHHTNPASRRMVRPIAGTGGPYAATSFHWRNANTNRCGVRARAHEARLEKAARRCSFDRDVSATRLQETRL